MFDDRCLPRIVVCISLRLVRCELFFVCWLLFGSLFVFLGVRCLLFVVVLSIWLCVLSCLWFAHGLLLMCCYCVVFCRVCLFCFA